MSQNVLSQMIQHIAEEGRILLFDVWMVNCWLLSSYVVA